MTGVVRCKLEVRQLLPVGPLRACRGLLEFLRQCSTLLVSYWALIVANRLDLFPSPYTGLN